MRESGSSSSSFASNKNPEIEKLPYKYEILGKLFNALDTSLLLLKSRGSKPIFLSLSRKIELLTERRFCYAHLGQIKHILPEAIEIKRILVTDETTSCMKPDLHVTLNPDAVKYDDDKSGKSENKRIAFRKLFRSRLAEFVKSHPQGDEVPEEPLPKLYNIRRKLNELESSPRKRSNEPGDVPVDLPAKLARRSTTWSFNFDSVNTPVIIYLCYIMLFR